jgi:tRNA pseudouridine55 synthase
MDGVLVIDKPSGPTSFDVVRRIRSLLRVKKAGHTGTLDPIATGVLPVCLNQATKIAGFITEGQKAYEAVIRLGVETDTHDAAGKTLAVAPVPPLSAETLEEILPRFRGSFSQTPPMYSAVKIDGKRLYELARAGEEVPRAPRPVTVYELVMRDFSASEVHLFLRCSKGFFVRVLAHDLGRALGCGAHLRSLRRTASGAFTEAQALKLDRVMSLCSSAGGRVEIERQLISIPDALADLPAVLVSRLDAVRVARGIPVEGQAPEGRVRLLDPAGALLAIAEIGPHHRFRYLRVFASGGARC